MQGRSLVPLPEGRTPADWRDAVYNQYFAYPDWHMVHRQYGIRMQRYKLIHYADDPVPHTPFDAPPALRRPESERPRPPTARPPGHRHEDGGA